MIYMALFEPLKFVDNFKKDHVLEIPLLCEGRWKGILILEAQIQGGARDILYGQIILELLGFFPKLHWPLLQS